MMLYSFKYLRLLFGLPKILIVFCLLILPCNSLQAQTAISTINTSTVAGTSTSNVAVAPSDAGNSIADDAGETFTINYGQGNNLKVVSYVVSSITYDRFLAPDTLVLNRAEATDRLVNIWFTLNSALVDNTPPTNDIANLDADEVEDADAIYLSGNLNAGYDNILVNIDDAAGGSIEVETERVDVIWYQGIQTSSPSTAVFPVIERGGNDNIAVAAITSLNVDGTPASYGNLVGIPENGWPGAGPSFDNYLILRRETAGSTPLPLLPIGVLEGQSAQIIQGVAISFSTFGISANTPVYGYSIFSADVVSGYVSNTSSAVTSGIVSIKAGIDLTDISTFPTDSRSNDSGIDLVAGVSAAVASDDNLIEVKGPGGYKAALSTWLKANAGVTTAVDASTVTDWQDQWLGNHDATTLTTAPTYRDGTASAADDINFNPTVDFVDGVERGLLIANNTDFNTATSYTTKGINLAFRTGNNISTKQQIYEQGSNNRGINVYVRNNEINVGAWNITSDGTGSPWGFSSVNTSALTGDREIATDTEYIITLEYTGNTSTAGTLVAYLNGQSFGTISSVGLLFADTDGIGLGDVNSQSRYDDGTTGAASFYGSIAELIYCNAPASFSTSQRNRIESYLALKYGITLDQATAVNYFNSNGSIIFNTSISRTIGGYLEYNNDIAGIGRDDASELDQSASKSENTGSVVTIDRGATISTDDTWLIWGNDGAALTETTGLTMPDTIDSRINRVWRVAEENEVLTTSVSFDITGLGLSTSQNDFSLLVAGNSSLADFSSATVLTGGVLVGNILTFSGVNLQDGEYFTLGTEYFICGPGGLTTGLTLWLKADKGVLNSSALITSGAADEWTNSIYNANFSEVAVTDGGEPVLNATGMNFNPYISFDGVDDFMEKENFLGSVLFSSQNNTIFYAFKRFDRPAPPDVLAGFQNSAGNTGRAGYFESSDLGRLRTDFYGDNVSGTLDIQDQYVIGRSYSDASNINVHINGYKDGEKVNAASLNTALEGDYAIGAGPNGGNDTESHAGEMIIFNTSLSATDANKVESYLALKYGITLSNDTDADATLGELLSGSATVTEGDYVASDGTSIFWNYGNHGTFINDVAGIGRDDASCLEQKQSRSENTDDVVTMGLGEIAVSNAANPNNIDTNLEFLVWANDNNSTAEADNVAYTEGTITDRMLRIWKVQETGTVGATDISFDLTGLGYTGSLSDYQLIVSDASGLTTPTIYQSASFTSNVITFNDIDLTDGQFFTLGTQRTACGPGGVQTNLLLWLRADAGTNTTTNGADVTSWVDQSASANNANDNFSGNSDPPAYISNGTNFNPLLGFSQAALNFLTVPHDVAFNSVSQAIFVAGTMNAASDDYSTFISKTQDYDWQEGWALAHEGANIIYAKDDSNDAANTAATPFPDGVPTIYLAYSDGSNDYINLNFEAKTSITSNTAAQTTQPIIIGATLNGTNTNVRQGLDGNIGDVMVFDDDLTATQRQQIATYLAVKYGITLDQTTATNYIYSDGTTVLWNGTTNSGYNQDIAGIGRDDASCFVQKQSKTVNSGEILTIGLNNIAATNALNANAFADDGDYLIWGNDAGTTAQATANVADVPSTISERMSRVWKVQDTGLVGNTELAFDLTGLGYSVDATDFSLIISNSSTMASGTLTTGGTFAGSVLSFSGINLTDGQYFTLATANTTCGPGGVNSNIALWLRADVEVFSDAGTTAAVDGNNALQWNDQSSPADNGSEIDLGGGSPIEPTFQTIEINFNPILRFSDPNSTNASYIETSSNSVSGNMTLISVFKTGQTAGTANDFVNSPALIGASVTASTADYGLGMDNGTIWMKASDDGDAFDVETAATFNNNRVHFTTATRTAAGAIAIYVDGNSEATGTGHTGTLTGPSSFGIGNHSDADLDAQYSGDIAETIVFSAVLNSDERNRVESYLALKYGMTMNASDDVGTGAVDERDYRAADGGVIWDYTGQTITYYNDIFGIGRDDLSCFEQRQSKSENLDAIVSFNLPAGFGTNDSFILSGNDGAVIEQIGNKERPAEINSRLNREWRVQETGTVGSIQVTFDLDDVTGPLGVGTNNLSLIRLMVDDDGDFSAGATLISPTSFNGTNNTVTFTVNFTDGQYYTLGSLEIDALPITLLSFEAKKSNENQVKLDWATADETNNSFFTIERSANGADFEAIANLQGAGNSESTNLYNWVDTNPNTGDNYYRLKQTDFNGESSVSEIVRVFIEFFVATGEFSVYPNPIQTGESLNIKYSVSEESQLEIKFVSTYGQVLFTQNETVFPESGVLSIPTNKLQRGLTLVIITNLATNQKKTFKVIVR